MHNSTRDAAALYWSESSQAATPLVSYPASVFSLDKEDLSGGKKWSREGAVYLECRVQELYVDWRQVGVGGMLCKSYTSVK